jgi:hypothetical protein
MTTTATVQFDIRPDGFQTERTLRIERITGIGAALVDDDQKFTYQATVLAAGQERLSVEFEHRYHDNVFILLEEALAAIRATGVTRL